MNVFSSYIKRHHSMLDALDLIELENFAKLIKKTWIEDRQVFICGNGGSAGNAMHIANDYIYGVVPRDKNGFAQENGIKINALPSNVAVLSCLANDEGFEHVFSEQLKVLANSGDLLIVLSGSGNSPNIINALRVANRKGINSFGLLGFDGGLAKNMCKQYIHFQIDDMQICEDLQLIVLHSVMQWLNAASQEKII